MLRHTSRASTTSRAFLALSCVGAFATASTARADPRDPALTGGPAPDADDQAQDVTVTGQRIEVQSNPKLPAALVDIPKSIVVVPKEVIEQTGSASLAEALRTVPGITFGAAEGGNPIGDRPFIRGFDSQGSTYVDGVRDFSAQTREVFAVDQIQVVRGSDSTLGGRGSAGGTINIVSKLPVSRDFVSASASYGTDDYKRLTLDANYKLTPTIGARVEAVWHDQDVAGRDAIWQKRWGVAPSITLGLDTATRLTVSGYYLESHELPDSGIPYLYTVANAPLGTSRSEPAIGDVTLADGTTGHVSRDTFYGLKDRDFRDARTLQATIRAEHDFGGVTLRNTSRFTHNYQAYSFLLPDDSTGNVFGTATADRVVNGITQFVSGGYVWRRANTRYGYADALTNQTDLFGTVHTGQIKHEFAAGVELDWEKARRGALVTRGFLNPMNGVETLSTGSTITPRCNTTTVARYYCTSLFDPNPNDPWVNYASDTSSVPAPIVKMLPQEETQNDATTGALYAFDSITFAPWLVVNLGARVDRFHSRLRPGGTYVSTTQVELTRTDTIFNWQAGVVIKPTPNTSLYASYATSATPPNALLGEGQEQNAIPTTGTPSNLALLDSLKVEKTRNYEAGAKADLFDHRLALNLAVFQTDTQNLRVVGADGLAQFIGERRIRGVELGVNGAITPWWNVFGGYTYLDPVITDGGFTVLTAPALTQTVGGATTTIQGAKTVQVVSVNTGRQATQTAKNSFTAWTNVTPFKHFQIGGGAFYTSRVYGGYQDNRSAVQNTAGVVTVVPATRTILRTIPGYWRFDARIAYDFGHGVELSGNVQNLTNKTYFSQAYTSHYATIAPGRSAFATLAVRF